MNTNLYIEHSNIPEQAAIEKSILRSLIYFDIFNYPLTANELAKYCSIKLQDIQIITDTLNNLTKHLKIFKFGEFYSLQNNSALVSRRKMGNKTAVEILPKALKRAKFIHKFPFVRSVNVSGSLSKNYFDSNSDIDFFIIAEANRIWLCRIFLTLYKKIFLLNSRKYFCINYYIDTADLQIPDRNLFSATEVVTLKNMSGESVYKSFIESNIWVRNYFPNFYPDYIFMDEECRPLFKRITEKLLSGKLGDKLDDFVFRFTTKFLKKKYAHLKPEEFTVNLRTAKNASKHHPQGFQFKVLKAFDNKCKDFELQHQMELN